MATQQEEQAEQKFFAERVREQDKEAKMEHKKETKTVEKEDRTPWPETSTIEERVAEQDKHRASLPEERDAAKETERLNKEDRERWENQGAKEATEPEGAKKAGKEKA